MERRAVNRMDDGRHAERPGGRPAQHAAFGTVGVNHVGPKAAQPFFDLLVARQVAPRINRPAEASP